MSQPYNITCVYGDNDADESCDNCNVPLCGACGFKHEGMRLCNSCYEEEKERRIWKEIDQYDLYTENLHLCNGRKI